jgi:hypothetical protein
MLPPDAMECCHLAAKKIQISSTPKACGNINHLVLMSRRCFARTYNSLQIDTERIAKLQFASAAHYESLISQSHYWINTRSSTCRQVGGEHGDQEKQCRYTNE